MISQAQREQRRRAGIASATAARKRLGPAGFANHMKGIAAQGAGRKGFWHELDETWRKHNEAQARAKRRAPREPLN